MSYIIYNPYITAIIINSYTHTHTHAHSHRQTHVIPKHNQRKRSETENKPRLESVLPFTISRQQTRRLTAIKIFS